jgi:hypothetical protein
MYVHFKKPKQFYRPKEEEEEAAEKISSRE